MSIGLREVRRYYKYARILKILLRRKPWAGYRILFNYLSVRLFKRKIVRKVEMGVTFECQCDCKKCSSFFMKSNSKEKLNLGEIKQAAKEILALGAVQINLTGGEPLLDSNFFDIVRCFKPHKTIITINTNGILLTKELIDRLENSGVDLVKISMDSPIEEEHDFSRRHKGCFRQVMKALEYIKQKKFLLAQISTVCIRENLNSDRIWKLVDLAKKYNALLGLTIPAASGRWLGDNGVLLGPQEKNILDKLIKIPYVVRDTDEGYAKAICPAGSEEFYLTCYGDIIPCPLIQISFGNVREKKIKEIWENMLDFKGFKNNQSGCLAGENKDFIENFLLPLKTISKLPVQIQDHPNFKRE